MSHRIFFALIVALSLSPVAAKENAPAAASEKRQSAEWVTRCDRVSEGTRMDCLEKLRAEALQRFLDNEAAAQQEQKDKAATKQPN
ncbi:MAG TPA: hypothetical protein VJU83_08070 [Burkholderiales bacterium]|nr:hypothetical protein [Burkholderiales bacterium]